MANFTRIQQKRTRGWRKPPNTVAVTRTTKWGNPYKEGMTLRSSYMSVGVVQEAGLVEHFLDQPIGYRITVEEALKLYRAHILMKAKENPEHYNFGQLRGKNLMCWCKPDEPCHADILLELVNV